MKGTDEARVAENSTLQLSLVHLSIRHTCTRIWRLYKWQGFLILIVISHIELSFFNLFSLAVWFVQFFIGELHNLYVVQKLSSFENFHCNCDFTYWIFLISSCLLYLSNLQIVQFSCCSKPSIFENLGKENFFDRNMSTDKSKMKPIL